MRQRTIQWRVSKRCGRIVPCAYRLIRCRLRGLHGDQRGTISIVSVFTLLALVILLGLVINTGQQVDQKIKMQNAADAATYAGGVVLCRNMNSLAFTNHLLSEVFALTAFMREGRARRAESLTPEILDNWERIGHFMFAPSEFSKFSELGLAINEKIPPMRALDGDREMVFAYSQWAAAAADLMLPVFEGILAEELIPRFQVALVEATPEMVQTAVDETATRHSEAWPRHQQLRAALWRTVGDPVGGVDEMVRGTLPVVNPDCNCELAMHDSIALARSTRDELAEWYLNDWNRAVLIHFDHYGQMNQFSNLWRIFTQGELDHLLHEEYAHNNLPHVLRDREPNATELELDYMFVGVVYQPKRRDQIPGVFRNPIQNDTIAFAQIAMFVPQARLVWSHHRDYFGPPRGISGGGIPGETNPFPTEEPEAGEWGPSWWSVVLQSSHWHSGRWSLFNQNWSAQLVPATAVELPTILSRQPYIYGDLAVELPAINQLTTEEVQWINHH